MTNIENTRGEEGLPDYPRNLAEYQAMIIPYKTHPATLKALLQLVEIAKVLELWHEGFLTPVQTIETIMIKLIVPEVD